MSRIVKVLSVEQSRNNITHSASIPHRESFVSSAGDEGVGVRQELNAVDGVSMAPQCAATPQTAQTNQQRCSGAFTSCLYFMPLLHAWCRKTHTYTNTHTLSLPLSNTHTHTHTHTPYTHAQTPTHTHKHTHTQTHTHTHTHTQRPKQSSYLTFTTHMICPAAGSTSVTVSNRVNRHS